MGFSLSLEVIIDNGIEVDLVVSRWASFQRDLFVINDGLLL